jgi:hypothetical protein
MGCVHGQIVGISRVPCKFIALTLRPTRILKTLRANWSRIKVTLMKPLLLVLTLACSSFAAFSADASAEFVRLFPKDGEPEGWLVRKWDDLKSPADAGVHWKVENGVLHGSEPRGTWLVSEKEYGDFVLEFEWKLGKRGNSGTALRAPLFGDPAFDGMELQMVDPRYYPSNMTVTPAELTGSLYKAVAPTAQLLKPMDWNKYQITCKGSSVKVILNGEQILDVDLEQQTKPTKRHDNTDAPPLKDRPRKGHLGFQELSREGGHVQIRNARIKVLD